MIDLLHHPLKGSHSFSIHTVQREKKSEKCYMREKSEVRRNLHSSQFELAAALMQI